MKKLLTALLLTVMSLGAISTSYAQTPPATTHTKKDGTADKRYKENKTKPVHTKKDGTPDKRYKENKTK